MGPKRKRNTDVLPCGGVLTLSNIENMTADEQTARIIAVVNDIKATIIFLSQHAKAETLTADQTHPFFSLLDDILGTGCEERKRLKMDLEECERELEDCERELEAQEKQHEIHIEAVKEAARAELRRLCRENRRLSCGKPTAFRSSSEPRVETCVKNTTETQVGNNDEVKVSGAHTLIEDKPAGDVPTKGSGVDSDLAEDKPIEEGCPIQVQKESDSIVEDRPLEERVADEQLKKDGVETQLETNAPKIADADEHGTDGKTEVERMETDESARN